MVFQAYPEHPKRTAIKLGHGDGALMVGEVEYHAGRTRAVIGYWRYTARFNELLATARAGEPVRDSGNDGVYMTVERRFVPAAYDGDGGLRGWLRLGFADDRLNTARPLFRWRPRLHRAVQGSGGDQAGIAFARAHFGGRYRRALAIDGVGSSASELSVEVTSAPWFPAGSRCNRTSSISSILAADRIFATLCCSAFAPRSASSRSVAGNLWHADIALADSPPGHFQHPLERHPRRGHDLVATARSAAGGRAARRRASPAC